MKEDLNKIKTDFEKELDNSNSLKALEQVRIKYLSRNGIVTLLFDKLKDVPKENKRELGRNLNELRDFITKIFDEKKKKIEAESKNTVNKLDLSLPANPIKIGSKHILNKLFKR
jgi:phenylalanyl-tRNA synthetase alpha chain